MGTGTNEAQSVFNSSKVTANMKAALVIRSGGETIFKHFAYYSAQGEKAHLHVETQLLMAVFELKEKLIAINNVVKVTLYCPWSPCPECTKNLQIIGLKLLRECGEKVRLKLVFDKYYTITNYTEQYPNSASNNKNYWESEESAQKAYNELMNDSGRIKGEEFRDCMVALGTRQLEYHVFVKEYSRLVIKKMDNNSGSTRIYL